MIGLGTVINTAAVAAGGLIGMRFRSGLKKPMQEILMQACGLASLLIGAGGTFSKMLVYQDGALETQGTMLLIFSLVIGSVIGEWLNIEQKMDRVGEKMKKAVGAGGDKLFVEGFVNASLVICVGAMAIVGSMQDGISGDYSLLTAKAILDFVIIVVFASTYGLGAACSAVAIFLYQGSLTLMAAVLGSFVSDVIISDLSFVGSALIFCVGVNIAFGKKFRVGNMLPSLLIPVIYHLIVG